MSSKPIGFFDSGVGGTSIWKECISLMPYENTIYLADSLFAPYGKKSPQRIIDLSIKNTEFLLKLGAKIIVVACNTATTNAIDYLRNNYDVPFVGIEPAIKPASLQTKTQAIGILATEGTLSSQLFSNTAKKWSSHINVITKVGHGLVEFIEAGDLDDPNLEKLLLSYCQPMMDANIDHLVLGCTHYPYLVPLLKKILPKDIKIIDSGHAVARQTKHLLSLYGLSNSSRLGHEARHQIFTNKSKDLLELFVADINTEKSIKQLIF